MADAKEFAHVLVTDTPVAVSDEGQWVATRKVVIDEAIADNEIELVLEREVSPGVWVTDTRATGPSNLALITPITKGGNYRWISRSKFPVVARLEEPVAEDFIKAEPVAVGE